MKFPWESDAQKMNLAWYLPRPKKNKYKGGMPLYCEEWLLLLAESLLSFRFGGPRILQVFSGVTTIGTRVDLNPEVKPDYLCDIHELTNFVTGEYDIILADPPFSNVESKELYGTPRLDYRKWTSECDKLLRVGGLFIIYHIRKMPNPNPKVYKTAKRVLVLSAPNHTARIAIFYKKGVYLEPEEEDSLFTF